MRWWVKALVVASDRHMCCSSARAPTFDAIFIYGSDTRAAGGSILPAERKAFYDNYRRWAAEVASLK
jgi:hypothetical protein